MIVELFLLTVLLGIVSSLHLLVKSDFFNGLINPAMVQNIVLPIVLLERSNMWPLTRLIFTANNGLARMIKGCCRSWTQHQWDNILDFTIRDCPLASQFFLPLACTPYLRPRDEVEWQKLLSAKSIAAIPTQFKADSVSRFFEAMQHIDELDQYGTFRSNADWKQFDWALFLKSHQLTPVSRYITTSVLSGMPTKRSELVNFLVQCAEKSENVDEFVGIWTTIKETLVGLQGNPSVSFDIEPVKDLYMKAEMALQVIEDEEGRVAQHEAEISKLSKSLILFKLWQAIQSGHGHDSVLQFAERIKVLLESVSDYDYVKLLSAITALPKPAIACQELAGNLRARFLDIYGGSDTHPRVFHCLSPNERVEYFRRWERVLSSSELQRIAKPSQDRNGRIIATLVKHYAEKPTIIHQDAAEAWLTRVQNLYYSQDMLVLRGQEYSILSHGVDLFENRMIREFIAVNTLQRLHYSASFSVSLEVAKSFACRRSLTTPELRNLPKMLRIAYNIVTCD